MTTDEKEPISAEEQARRDQIRAEALEILMLRQRRGLPAAISASQIMSWISPSLNPTPGGIATVLSILAQEGVITKRQRKTPTGRHLANEYVVCRP